MTSVSDLRERAKMQRENGWELMREGDPALLDWAADEIETAYGVLADQRRLTRELDVALNGDGAARQASLCDIVSQVKDRRWKLVRQD
jgi:hypothetical protein